MTKIEEVLEYIRGNSYATNKEISDDLKIGDGVVRVYINRLKDKGYIEKVGSEYKVLKEMPVNKSCYKQEIIKEMLEVYMDDFREIKVINEKIRVGELIISCLLYTSLSLFLYVLLSIYHKHLLQLISLKRNPLFA